jgi:hypothetical protein
MAPIVTRRAGIYAGELGWAAVRQRRRAPYRVERVAPSPRGARAPGCPFLATPSPTKTKPGNIASTNIARNPLPQAGPCPIPKEEA